MAAVPISPLGSTGVDDLWSEAVGDTFRIFHAECGPDPKAMLLLTDANGLFGLTVDTVRLMQLTALVPSMLVVGVGYPTASTLADTIQIRARDLTPTPTALFDKGGGADHFIRFLETELRPWLRARHPAAMDDSTYFGHSLGGLFGTYAMLIGSRLCTRYILSSPSLWWDDRLMFDLERDSAELSTAAFIGIGALETDEGRRAEAANLPDGHRAKPGQNRLDMVDDVRRFAAQITARNHAGLSLETVVIPDEFHVTVPGAVLSRALQYFFAASRADNRQGSEP